jgi:hypothetical protein
MAAAADTVDPDASSSAFSHSLDPKRTPISPGDSVHEASEHSDGYSTGSIMDTTVDRGVFC